MYTTVLIFISQSLAIRGAKFLSVCNISAQKLASSGKQRILNFRVMAVLDTELRMRLLKKKVPNSLLLVVIKD